MPVVATCRECFVRDQCGGWTAPEDGEPLLTCFEAFGSANGLFIDPKDPKKFAQRLAEVRFFELAHPLTFVPVTTELPDYLTIVQGGVSFSRSLSLDFAALNLVEVFHGDKSHGLAFGQRPLTADSLRAEWGLAPSTKIILSGVADDPTLERLWGNYRVRNLAQQVADLGVVAVTAPNFTFWKNAPRLENIVNRLRMFRIAEALTEKGVAVIPHVNSTHPRDWEWMLAFYREHPELKMVCMEFRTGNRIAEVRQRKIAALARLRDALGRELHPVVVGNLEAAREIRHLFPHVTAIDSMPALKTIRRQEALQRIGVGLSWRTQPLAAGACMAELFERNYSLHLTHVLSRLTAPMETQADSAATASLRKISRASNQSRQGELPLEAA